MRLCILKVINSVVSQSNLFAQMSFFEAALKGNGRFQGSRKDSIRSTVILANKRLLLFLNLGNQEH